LKLKRISLVVFLASTLIGTGALLAQESTPLAPDNSAVNARDRDAGAVTADQQSNAKNDVELTRRIRRAVTKDQRLSMMARNVKIISADGGVTLRGPVESEKEKRTIAHIARKIAGTDKIDNQLEVKGQ
jgi:hyperosmotically inducible periplasmic protein